MAKKKENSSEPKRVRIIVDTDARRRAAVRLYGIKKGKSITAIFNDWIDEKLARELKEYDEGDGFES